MVNNCAPANHGFQVFEYCCFALGSHFLNLIFVALHVILTTGSCYFRVVVSAQCFTDGTYGLVWRTSQNHSSGV